MDFNILDDVLSKLNRKLARERRKNILFLDNAPCHPPDMKGKYDHIKIVFFPPNCTYRLQPLDLGIIQTFKLKHMSLAKYMTATLPLRCPSLWIYSKQLGGLPKPGKTCQSQLSMLSMRTLWHVPLVSVLTGFHCKALDTKKTRNQRR